MIQDIETIKQLSEHYQHIAQSVASQLALETPNHHVTSGTSRENVWNEVFRNFVPNKYNLAQNVFIIDSFGHISAEVDIAIYDEQYTPYIFNYGNILFIPIEAVAIVVQSKSRTLDKADLKAWVKTIKNLQPVLNAYVRTQQSLLDTNLKYLNGRQSQTATRPLIILCTFSMEEKKIQDLKSNFDIILYLNKEQKLVKNDMENLTDLNKWYEELNHYGHIRYGADYQKLKELANHKEDTKIKDIKVNDAEKNMRDLQDVTVKSNILLSLKFELNQLLMLVNNPIFFPHASYVKMFNDALKFQRKVEEIEMQKKNDYLLAVYDITGIQEYIFASNRLQENMGASFIVGNMVREHFSDIAENYEIKTEWHTENGDALPFMLFDNKKLKGEVVYIGGGNALVVYRDWEIYNKINKEFALKVLEESASLTMVTEAIPFSEKEASYKQLYSNLMEKLSDTKSKVVRTKLNQTLPIFAQEPFKGEPITRKTKEGLYSTEQWLKRKVGKKDLFTDISDKFAKEMVEMKRKVREDSYIAVIHIDGNGMGEWLKKRLQNQNLKDGIQRHRASSLEITGYFRTVFAETVNEMKVEKEIPLRPLILDGDDITFICQADRGIEFTKSFLDKLNGEIHACAGIALVHSHFPFQLAYDIAEQCCQRAKKRYYQEKSGSYLDFYLVRGSYVQTMDEQLATLGDLASEAYDKQQLETLLDVVKDLTANWSRSRLIQLYEAYLSDEEAVMRVKAEAESRGYQLTENNDKVIFAALQLMEFVQKEEETNATV